METLLGTTFERYLRILDILLLNKGKPVLSGLKGGLREDVHKVGSFLRASFVGEDSWLLMTVLRMYSSYLRSYLILRPSLIKKTTTVNPEDLLLSKFGGLSVKTLKSLCLSPITVLLRNSKELTTFLSPKATRSLKSWLKTRVSDRKLTFVNTCLQLKRTAERVPKSFILEALRKHKSYITAPQSRQPRDSKKRCIARVRKYLGGWTWRPKSMERVSDFSLNSCIESSRMSGGIYGYWFRKVGEQIIFREENGVVTIQKGLRFPFRYEIFSELKDHNYSFSREVVPILEPLKVRVITKGHACESPFWASFQKSLAKRLAKDPRILSGKDFKHEPFQQCYDSLVRNEELTGEPWIFVSDDGDAATDSIHPNLSIGVIIERIPKEYRSVFAKSFFATDISYWSPGSKTINPDTAPDLESAPQLNGQLMGDRRSFPLLCLIHLIWKIIFLEENDLLVKWMPKWEQYFRLDQIILINGDDGLIGLPERLVPAYLDWMNQLWTMNPLKTFIRRDLASFNSQLWRMGPQVRKVGLFRWNLIYRIDKYGDESQDPRVWNDILEDSAGFADELWPLFVRSWKPIFDYLEKRDPGHNWFLPLSVGGFGLEAHKEFVVTPRQNAAIRQCEAYLGKPRAPPCATRVAKVGGRNRFLCRWTWSMMRERWGWDHQVREPRPGNFKEAVMSKLMIGRLPKSRTGNQAYEHLVHWKLTFDENTRELGW
jgi:hypothetical protein